MAKPKKQKEPKVNLPESAKVHTFSLEFGPSGIARLEEIAKKAGCETKADLIRNALRLYEWYLGKVKEERYKLQLARPNDEYVREVDIKFK